MPCTKSFKKFQLQLTTLIFIFTKLESVFSFKSVRISLLRRLKKFLFQYFYEFVIFTLVGYLQNNFRLVDYDINYIGICKIAFSGNFIEHGHLLGNILFRRMSVYLSPWMFYRLIRIFQYTLNLKVLLKFYLPIQICDFYICRATRNIRVSLLWIFAFRRVPRYFIRSVQCCSHNKEDLVKK